MFILLRSCRKYILEYIYTSGCLTIDRKGRGNYFRIYHSVRCTVLLEYCIRKKYSSILQSTLLQYKVRYNEPAHNVHCCTGLHYCATNYCTEVQYCKTDSPEYSVHCVCVCLCVCVCVTEYDHSWVLYTVEQIYPST